MAANAEASNSENKWIFTAQPQLGIYIKLHPSKAQKKDPERLRFGRTVERGFCIFFLNIVEPNTFINLQKLWLPVHKLPIPSRSTCHLWVGTVPSSPTSVWGAIKIIEFFSYLRQTMHFTWIIQFPNIVKKWYEICILNSLISFLAFSQDHF